MCYFISFPLRIKSREEAFEEMTSGDCRRQTVMVQCCGRWLIKFQTVADSSTTYSGRPVLMIDDDKRRRHQASKFPCWQIRPQERQCRSFGTDKESQLEMVMGFGEMGRQHLE